MAEQRCVSVAVRDLILGFLCGQDRRNGSHRKPEAGVWGFRGLGG